MGTFKTYIFEAGARQLDPAVTVYDHSEKPHIKNNITHKLYDEAQKHSKSFSAEHNNTIRRYKAASNPHVNDYLRNGNKKIESHHDTENFDHIPNNYSENEVKHLAHVTNSPTKHSFAVYRGFGKGFPADKLKIGDTFHDPGFSSTSLRKKTSHYHQTSIRDDNEGKYHKYIAKIQVKPGIKGHYLDHTHEHEYSDEHEFLLHKGTHFKVLRHTQKNDGMYVHHVIHLGIEKQDD